MCSFIGRRWVFPGAVAVLALVVLDAILLFSRHNPEIGRLDDMMAQLASGASNEARPLFLEAGQVARDLLRDFPDDAEALDAVARLYQRFRNSKDAIRCWQRSIELDPNHTRPRMRQSPRRLSTQGTSRRLRNTTAAPCSRIPPRPRTR